MNVVSVQSIGKCSVALQTFAAVLIEKKSELLKSQFRGFSHFKVLNYTQDASSSVVSPVVGAIVSHSYFVSGVSLFLLFSFQPPS